MNKALLCKPHESKADYNNNMFNFSSRSEFWPKTVTRGHMIAKRHDDLTGFACARHFQYDCPRGHIVAQISDVLDEMQKPDHAGPDAAYNGVYHTAQNMPGGTRVICVTAAFAASDHLLNEMYSNTSLDAYLT